ncbi:MAG TPA: ATP-binding protein [Planctomycetaceae bacterium]|jgi:signal transduction histidine kinase/ActR/RegA family two-component response regulator|nr:ATP-binding protein [Planctomycetaceae bacterium]
MPEQDRNQDLGELSAQPFGVELPPATRADLLDPALWQDGLAKYARATNLAVALADTAGRLIGDYINPRPTWSFLHSKTPTISSSSAGGVGCPFSLAPLSPCSCVADALARDGVVVARDRTGLVHFAVPLVLGGDPLGALVAGQFFTRYPEQLPLEHFASQLRLSSGKAWELARLEHPIKQATLEVYADLLATLGQTFLQTHYHSLREAERLAEMTRLRDHAIAEATQRKRVEESQHFLAEASVEFTSLDYETTLKNLARRAVPFLADFCFFDVVISDERIQRVGWAHADPAKQELFDKVCRLVPALNFKDHSVAEALLTGQPDFEPEITDAWMQTAATSPQHLQFMRDLGLGSMMAVPLIAHKRKLGALTFCYTAASGRRYAQRELRLAEELARRTAMVVENAKLYHALQEADHRKDEFLAMLGHELRNPLAPILNAVQLLQNQKDQNSRQQKAQTIIERQVIQLTHLVDDLLDVSRAITGRIELRREPIAVGGIMERAVETVRPLIDQRKHELTVSLPPDPIWLYADAARLEQVVTNLLTNAVKYTSAGGHIWLSVQQEDDKAVLRVRDTGLGITPAFLPHVFDLFTQAERSSDRLQGGLGIGLALVKRLVEMHEGTVSVSSTLGQGSEFVVSLPVDQSVALSQKTQPPPIEIDEAISAGLRVLIVDDNVDAVTALELLLQESGHLVRVAHTGPTGLAAALDFRPDVMLLDIGLPELDGWNVAERIRQQPALHDIVLVAMTGYGQNSDRQRSERAGFDHHFVKPVEFRKLRHVLAAVSEKAT